MRSMLSVVTVTGVAVLAALGGVFAAQHPTETSGRLWHQLGGWSLALLLWLVGGALLWAYLVVQPSQKLKKGLLLAGLITVAISDLWFFGFKMVVSSPTTPEIMWSDAKQIIGDVNERVLPWGVSLFWQNGAGQVGLRSVFGYNSLELADYEYFVTSVPDPRATTYDILGAKYVISPVQLDQFAEGTHPLTLVDKTDAVWVYRRDWAVPVARLVYEVEVLDDLTATIDRIHQAGFDPVQTVILSEPPSCNPATGTGTAIIEQADPGFWRINTQSDTAALLVLAETTYPGWQVTVDGELVAWQKAYGMVRAVCVPAGEHTVEWTFRPLLFGWGAFISLITLGGVLVVGLRRRFSTSGASI
jgi:hypothetical protein